MRQDKFFPETKPVDAIGQKLLDAAEILRSDGWCRFEFTDARGRHCVNGAIEKACGWADDTHQYVKAKLARFLGHPYDPQPGVSLLFWNDNANAAEEVISALQSAALLP